MKFKDIEESIRRAEGNIKHEGMYITDEERELIREKAKGNLTQDEFIKKVVELHTTELEYKTISEELKEIGFEREEEYK